MLGLSAHTIRAWERRHAAVAPERGGNGQRRYSLDDIETLKRVKDLASSRGLSLRLAVGQATGEVPQLSAAQSDEPGPDGAVDQDGGPWRALADLDSGPVLILDPRGRVYDCNVAFARLAGELRFRVRGRLFSELVDPFDRAKAVAIYRGSRQPRRGWELNLRTAMETGLFSFDCVPFQYHEGWLIACSGRPVA